MGHDSHRTEQLVQSESQFIYVMLSTPVCLQASMFTSHVRENKIFN